MARLEIGEYLAIIRDRQSKETGRMIIVPRKRFPLMGEAIPVGEKRYRVVDIEHPVEESDQFDRFLYTDLVVYLVDEADWTPSTGGRDPEDKSKPEGPSTPSHLASVVLPFRAPRIDAASAFLPHIKLIAWIVMRGYEEQAFQLERLKFASYVLDWNGDGWVAQEMAAGRTAEELRALSRAAKRGQAEADAFCRQVLPLVAVEAEEQLAEVIELAAFRRG